jgi:hypothetical protein
MMLLIRQPSTPDGTLGELRDDDNNHLCFTIERPWLDNKPDVSCIPPGRYEFSRYISPKHGSVWKANNVPNRTFIEIHPANLADELEGCIGVGSAIGSIDGKPAVLASQETFKMLQSKLPDDFILTIQG